MDNASNNMTMVDHLNKCIESLHLELSSNGIALVPCLAHMLQLALGVMLDTIKINPQNDQIDLNWDESMHSTGLHGIPLALSKVCKRVLFTGNDWLTNVQDSQPHKICELKPTMKDQVPPTTKY